MVSLDRAEAVLERMETVNVTVAVPANETAGGTAPKASVTAASCLHRCSCHYSVMKLTFRLTSPGLWQFNRANSKISYTVYSTRHAARFRAAGAVWYRV